MLSIRLRRHGARRDPHYRVVVTERSAKRDGPFIEILGHYHPRKRPAEIVFNVERTESWIDKGAIMSDTVRTLYHKVKSGELDTVEPEAPASRPVDTAAATAEPAETAVETDEEGPGTEESVSGEGE